MHSIEYDSKHIIRTNKIDPKKTIKILTFKQINSNRSFEMPQKYVF